MRKWLPYPKNPAYLVCDDGRVLGVRGKEIGAERGKGDGSRYRFVQAVIPVDGRPRCLNVARMVLETFVGPPPEGHGCRHLNGNPVDNRLGNLKWGTQAANMHDTIAHGTRLHGEKNPSAKLSDYQVAEIRAHAKRGILRHQDMADMYGISRTQISRIVNNKHRKETTRWL